MNLSETKPKLLMKNIVIAFLLFCAFSRTQSQSPTYNIKVLNNGYNGWLCISSHVDQFFLHGDTTIPIKSDVSGAYYLNTGATIGACYFNQTSYIFLFFNKDGNIDSLCPKESATIGIDKKSISLNTASITIDPGNFVREWYPSFGAEIGVRPGFYYGKQTIKLIKGQTYGIDNSHSSLAGNDGAGNSIYYGSYFYFTVNKEGKVILYDKNMISAIALGSTLKFKTVIVDIDPIEISGGSPLYIRIPFAKAIKIANKTKVVFIRGMVNYVYWNNSNGKEMYFHFLPM